MVLQLTIVLLFAFVASIQADAAVKIFSKDETLAESNMTKPHVYIQNTGTVALSGIKFYYYFTTENDKTPILENYYAPGFTVALQAVSSGNYKVEYTLNGTLNVGAILPDNGGCVVGLHYNTWDAWDKTNDYSNNRLSSFDENPLIPVYQNGTLIYGTEPGSGGGSTPPAPAMPDADLRLNSFALYSTQQTIIKERSIFYGGGAVGSNVFVEIKNNAVVRGNVVSGANATLWNSVLIDGKIILGGTLTQAGIGNTFTSLQEGETVATLSLPDFPVTTSTNHVTVNQNATRDLEPGIYGDLNVLQKGILRLVPGNYTFAKFYIENGAKVIFQIDDYLDKIVIASSGEFNLQDSTELKFATMSYAPSVQIYSRDQNELRIGVNAKTVGIITAPFATVNIYSGSRCDGAIYAKIINVEPDAIINSAYVDPDRDDDGDGVPTGIEVNPFIRTDPNDPTSYIPVAIPKTVRIDNTNKVIIEYSLKPFYHSYSDSVTIKVLCPSNSLKDPYTAPIIRIVNTPSNGDSGIADTSGYSQFGQFFELVGAPVKKDSTIYISVPPPANSLPGDYLAGIWDPGLNTWVIEPDPVYPGLGMDDRDSLENGGGIIGPVFGFTSPGPGGPDPDPVLVITRKKMENVVAYFDDGTVFSSHGSMIIANCGLTNISNLSTTNPGTIVINYTDLSNTTTPPPVILNLIFYEKYEKIVYGNVTFNAPNFGFRINSVEVKLNKSDGTAYTPILRPINKSTSPGESYTINIRCEQSKLDKDESFNYFPSTTMSFESQPLAGEGLIQLTAGSFNYSYFLKDHLGSTRMVLNEDGEIKEALMYQPYGTVSDVQAINAIRQGPLRDKFTTKEFDEEGPEFGQIEFNIALDFALTHSDPTKPNRIEVYYDDAPANPQIINITIDPDNDNGKVNAVFKNTTSRTIASIQFKLNDETVSCNVQNINEIINSGSKLTISQTFTDVSEFTPTVLKTFLNYSNASFYMAGIGAYHFGARMYNAELGMWQSVDNKKQFWNVYGYSGNKTNPLSFIDPNGLEMVYIIAAGKFDDEWEYGKVIRPPNHVGPYESERTKFNNAADKATAQFIANGFSELDIITIDFNFDPVYSKFSGASLQEIFDALKDPELKVLIIYGHGLTDDDGSPLEPGVAAHDKWFIPKDLEESPVSYQNYWKKNVDLYLLTCFNGNKSFKEVWQKYFKNVFAFAGEQDRDYLLDEYLAKTIAPKYHYTKPGNKNNKRSDNIKYTPWDQHIANSGDHAYVKRNRTENGNTTDEEAYINGWPH